VQADGTCSFVVISNYLPTLDYSFPKNRAEVSGFYFNQRPEIPRRVHVSPREVPVRLLAWPSLEELNSSGQEKAPSSPSSFHEPKFATDKGQVEAEEDGTQHPSTCDDEETSRKPQMPAITPLKNLETIALI
jgi:hypothetical protein